MKEKIWKRGLQALLLTMALAVVLFHASLLVPPLMILTPLPFVFLGFHRGHGHAFCAQILTIALLAALYSLPMVVPLFLFLPFSHGMIQGMRRHRSAFCTIGWAAGGFSVALFALVGYMQWNMGRPFLDWLEERMMLELTMVEKLAGKSILSPDILQGMQQALVFFPAGVIIVGLLMALVNYYSVMALIKKTAPFEYILFRLPGFSTFHLPSDLWIGIFLLFSGSFLLQGLGYPKGPELRGNLTLVLSFLFMLTGLALADFFLKRRVGLVARALVLGSSLFFMGGVVYLILGILDMLFKIRWRMSQS